MKTTLKFYSTTFIAILLMLGCTRTVTRIDPDKEVDLSGRWNDTDSKLVAQEMTSDMINRPWRAEFHSKQNKRPTIIVGQIKNKSHEHIDAETFIKNIEKECINTATIRVVQNADFREKMREERADQQQFASPETQKKWGRELGADYMVFGNINSIVDTYNKKKVVYYQINLELADLETNEIVWIGEKKIKKFITN